MAVMQLLASLVGLVLLAGASRAPAQTPPPREAGAVHVAELRGIVHPLSEQYLVDAIDRADAEQAALLLIELDTPGGLVDSTKTIVQHMLAARTPIVVYVTPPGARAASAGFLLLIGADVAAMAPATNTGAAHPIDASGSASAEEIGMKKAENDLAAFARTIASNRHRNVDAAESAVTESASFTEDEALAEGLIDLIARDRTELLARLDGRQVRRLDGSEVTLSTQGRLEEPVERSLVQRWLGPLLRPELVLLLLGIGVTGIYIELSHPGLILPGLIGVLCLLLFALAFQYLPINFIGLLLISLGVVLFLLEIKVASYGLLTIGGLACLSLGLFLLFPRDVPALRVSWTFVLPLALSIGGVMAVVVLLVSRAQRLPVANGPDAMVGELGRAHSEIAPLGKVYVHGEIWDARSDRTLTRGDEIRVVRVDGMTLVVEKKEITT